MRIWSSPTNRLDAANTASADSAAIIEAATLENRFATRSARAGIPIHTGNAYTGSASSGPIGGWLS